MSKFYSHLVFGGFNEPVLPWRQGRTVLSAVIQPWNRRAHHFNAWVLRVTRLKLTNRGNVMRFHSSGVSTRGGGATEVGTSPERWWFLGFHWQVSQRWLTVAPILPQQNSDSKLRGTTASQEEAPSVSVAVRRRLHVPLRDTVGFLQFHHQKHDVLLGLISSPVPDGADEDQAAHNGCLPLLRTEQGSWEHVSLHITVSLYVYIYKSTAFTRQINLYYLSNEFHNRRRTWRRSNMSSFLHFLNSSSLPFFLKLFHLPPHSFLKNSFLAFSRIVSASASFLYSHHPPRGLCPSIWPFLLSPPSRCFSFTSGFCVCLVSFSVTTCEDGAVSLCCSTTVCPVEGDIVPD